MKENAKNMLDRLILEYDGNDDALELLHQSYDEILSYPPERALLLAKQAEGTLAMYF